MKIVRYNKRIDDFRFLAALFVVAIHTAPFADSIPLLSYTITNVIGRFAVPFFFVLSGYFLFKKMRTSKQPDAYVKTQSSLIKTYLLTMIIYIPVWIYLNGVNVTQFVFDVFINGVHYHLWYFPALILGIAIVYFLYDRLNAKLSLILLGGLYLFGSIINVYGFLLPDVELIAWIGNPRNGIFFAPLFVYIGQQLAVRSRPINPLFFVLSLLLFFGETYSLYFFNVSDPLNSMFVTLPLVIYYGMSLLLQADGKKHNSGLYHQLSLYIYIIHPVVILGLRLIIGKILMMELNPTLMFILTLILSIGSSILYYQGKKLYEKNK